MTNLSIEIADSHRRIEGVILEEQKRLNALGIGSRSEFYMKACMGAAGDECIRLLQLSLAQRLLCFLRNR